MYLSIGVYLRLLICIDFSFSRILLCLSFDVMIERMFLEGMISKPVSYLEIQALTAYCLLVPHFY